MPQGGSHQEEEKTAGDGDTGEVAAVENVIETIQETGAASASNEAEKSRPVSSEITPQTGLSHQEPSDATPVTPTKEVAAELLSPERGDPQREDIYVAREYFVLMVQYDRIAFHRAHFAEGYCTRGGPRRPWT
jgi:hypothetical protein